MRKIALFLTLFITLHGYEIPVDCTQIFEARKAEIIKEIDVIDEERQALEAFRASTKALYDENFARLNKKESDINATLRQVEKKRKEIDEQIIANQKILDELRAMTTDKVSASYAKMKDQAAADILSDMSVAKAAAIMYALEPKKISAIMAKMQPAKASEITQMLTKGPPFKDEIKDESFSAPSGNVLNLGN